MADALLTFYQNYAHWFYWLALLSVACLVVSVLLIPVIIKRLPYDYFIQIQNTHSVQIFRWRKYAFKLFANALGFFLILAGVVMLFIPGQGLLTILIGLMMLDIPGKKRLELYIVSIPAVINSLNWLRRKQGLSEFQLPQD